ncbi:MAG: PilZ domain-containing protein [bacterium]|nr:PilZ domain-containing protein [bacterium]
MFSVKATFHNGQFQLEDPLFFKGKAKVIVTLLEGDSLDASQSIEVDDEDNLSEEELRALRRFERHRARGTITINEEGTEEAFKLFDYSKGGLSFISKRPFEKGRLLTAHLKDALDSSSSVLEFEFEVARSVEHGQEFKIGCKFTDDIDEGLWHDLMRTSG